MTAGRGLSDRERWVLNELAHVCSAHAADRWNRPMDVGGSNGSHHSTTLRALVRRGFVERRDRAGRIDGRGGRAQSWLYRITAEGRAALELFAGGS